LRGLCLGRAGFPRTLNEALACAGVVVEEASDPGSLAQLAADRAPAFVLSTSAALSPNPEEAAASVKRSSSVPIILVTEERMAPQTAGAATSFDEMLGSDQDALGYFLMLRSTLRRKRPHAMTDMLSFRDWSLDQEKFLLSLGGKQAPLNKLQFCMLGAMFDAPRMVWNKVFLNRVVFGPVDWKPGRQFDTYMSLVRRPIRDKLGIDPIVAEQRRGYALFLPDLHWESEGSERSA
jgi:DNA-binding response OmpR family regulator